MKLPSFQQQQGTSMGSAMTTPPRIGPIKQRTPETRPLVAERPVGGILAAGMAKSRMYQNIGQSISQVADVGLRIKEADETMSANAAIGEYNNRMAQWQTNSKLTANELDEDTGLRRWETLEDDRAIESKALKAELRDKYKFTMRKAESAWALKTDSMDATYKGDVMTFTNQKRIERSGATYQIAMAYRRGNGKPECR